MEAKIRKAKKENRLVLGYKEVLKNLDQVSEIFIASNCPREIAKKIKEEAGSKVKEIGKTNMKIGEMIGKPFSISCLGIK